MIEIIRDSVGDYILQKEVDTDKGPKYEEITGITTLELAELRLMLNEMAANQPELNLDETGNEVL